MPVSLARKGVWIAGAVVALIIMVVAALPLVASTQIVRDSIASQMSVWSGYRVRFDGRPTISVWPTFRAVLNDVTLLDWNEATPGVVLSAERVEMDLSALAALRGEVVFTRLRLIRPALRLRERDGTLHLPLAQDWGRLTNSINVARQAVSNAPGEPDTSVLPADSFGTVEFSQGRITAGSGEQQRDLITSLTGTIDWPAMNRQASLSASGIWQGENVTLTASSTQPLILLGGGNAPLDFTFEAAPANASFQGIASLAGDNFVDGQLTVSAPSIGRLLEWTQAHPLPQGRLGPIDMTARVIGDTRRLKFEETSLDLDTSSGRGLLDLTFGEGSPTIAGTLAFDTLNLRALLNAFGPFSSILFGAGEMPATPNGADYDFDVRFSAVNASYGAVELSDVAAAARIRDGLATFDISDATAFGGTVQFGLRTDRTGKDDTVELRMMGEGIDTARLAATFGQQKLVPQAPGAFSLVLKGIGQDFETVLTNAEGSFSANFGQGSVPGLSLDAFFQNSEAGDFFPLAALESGSLPIEGAEVKASFGKGLAQLETTEVRSGQYVISLDGLVPFAGRALALYGTLAAPEGTDSRLEQPVLFFVGGSWNAPFIASFLRPTGESANDQ